MNSALTTQLRHTERTAENRSTNHILFWEHWFVGLKCVLRRYQTTITAKVMHRFCVRRFLDFLNFIFFKFQITNHWWPWNTSLRFRQKSRAFGNSQIIPFQLRFRCLICFWVFVVGFVVQFSFVFVSVFCTFFCMKNSGRFFIYIQKFSVNNLVRVKKKSAKWYLSWTRICRRKTRSFVF